MKNTNSKISDKEEVREELFELLEGKDDLMLQVFDVILEISEEDNVFQEQLLDRFLETKFSRQFTMKIGRGNHSKRLRRQGLGKPKKGEVKP